MSLDGIFETDAIRFETCAQHPVQGGVRFKIVTLGDNLCGTSLRQVALVLQYEKRSGDPGLQPRLFHVE